MQAVPIPVLPPVVRIRPRTALVASADRNFRQRLAEILTGLRWQVRETEGGAQAWAEAEAAPPEAIIVDSWLPDLDLGEFLEDFRESFPRVDLFTASGSSSLGSPRGPYRQELLYALRRCQDTDTASWNAAPALDKPDRTASRMTPAPKAGSAASAYAVPASRCHGCGRAPGGLTRQPARSIDRGAPGGAASAMAARRRPASGCRN